MRELRRIPHPIPYQGSKRRLAPAILSLLPSDIETLIEPFAGSAAITLAAASRKIASRHLIADKLPAIAGIWRQILKDPAGLADEYERIWNGQADDARTHYATVRSEFNVSGNPAQFLFLAARCVKNAIRFNPKGEFNQSADHRRMGMRPARMRLALQGSAELLGGKAEAMCCDYREALCRAKQSDIIYMDPPYQGVSEGRDSRYAEQLDVLAFYEELDCLNHRGIQYAVSFDGYCGNRQYGTPPPAGLNLALVEIETGRSSQATLNGINAITIESLYLSPALARRVPIPTQRLLVTAPRSTSLFL